MSPGSGVREQVEHEFGGSKGRLEAIGSQMGFICESILAISSWCTLCVACDCKSSVGERNKVVTSSYYTESQETVCLMKEVP